MTFVATGLGGMGTKRSVAIKTKDKTDEIKIGITDKTGAGGSGNMFVFEREAGRFELGDHFFEKFYLVLGEGGFLGIVGLGKMGIDTFNVQAGIFFEFDKELRKIVGLKAKTAEAGIKFEVNFGAGLILIEGTKRIEIVNSESERELFPNRIILGIGVAGDKNRGADGKFGELVGFVEGVDDDVRSFDPAVDKGGNLGKTVAVGIGFENRADLGLGI